MLIRIQIVVAAFVPKQIFSFLMCSFFSFAYISIIYPVKHKAGIIIHYLKKYQKSSRRCPSKDNLVRIPSHTRAEI
jgi:hypothetical protein